MGNPSGFFSSIVALLIFLTMGCSCEQIMDHAHRWGQKDRLERREKIEGLDVKKWERQLNLSRARSIELHRHILELVSESHLQGQLSRKIAYFYLQKGSYDLASLYYNGALQKKILKAEEQKGNSYMAFEQSLSHFDRALLLSSSDVGLFYEAGLAYANASRSQGWELKRFRIAEMLFKRMARMAPEDMRSRYQLALLYGKTTLREFRDKEHAIRLLEQVLQKEEKHIPARFALAHLLAERGHWAKAAETYEDIQKILRDLHRQKVIGGSLDSYPHYRRAKENQLKLQECLQGRPGCSL